MVVISFFLLYDIKIRCTYGITFLFIEGEHETNNSLMSSTSINQAGYMDGHHGPPTAESIYGLSQYYTGGANSSAAAASESWKSHQEQYTSPYSTSSVPTKEGFSRDIDGRYQHTSVGSSTTVVPQSSGSPYNSSESHSLHAWNRNSTVPNEEIGDCSRSTASYDCY